MAPHPPTPPRSHPTRPPASQHTRLSHVSTPQCAPPPRKPMRARPSQPAQHQGASGSSRTSLPLWALPLWPAGTSWPAPTALPATAPGGAWEGLDTLGCSGTGCSLPRGWRPGEDWSPKGGSKGRLGGRGAPTPTPPSQSHCARLSEWWTRARMHTHFRWRAPGSHTLSVHPAAQVPHKRVYIVPPPWPPAHQRPAQLPHMVKLQSLHSGRQRQGRGHGVTFCSIRKRPHRPPCPAKGLGV